MLKIANGLESEKEFLFDYLMAAGERNSQFKEEWQNRAGQVLNEKITDDYFAIWLARREDSPEYGNFAKKLLKEYRDSQRNASTNLKVKTAVADGEFRDLKTKVDSVKNDVRDIKKDHKDFESRLKSIEKEIKDLNIGRRMFSDQKTIFTSLERKMERMEAVTQEWKNYKKEMDDEIKRMVEKRTKARISDVTPKAY